ncbi:hypothetical protein RB595_001923 [Gaeumannomyces hyphopodioides]
MAAFLPKVLSPALPSELISYILGQYKYPTTLVSSPEQSDGNTTQGPPEKHKEEDHSRQEPCPLHAQGSRPEGAAESTPMADAATTERARTILSTPLRQTAVARHIRTVFVPTVSHLRAFLSVFSAEADPSSKARPPPTEGPPAPGGGRLDETSTPRTPLLLAYGLLELHRDTSEWNAQGLGSTAACLVEAAHRSGMEAVVVEPAVRVIREVLTQDDEEGQEERDSPTGDRVFVRVDLDGLLSEEVPVLNMAARRLGRDGDGLGWSGRTVPVRRVLGRWFCF